MVFVKEHSNVLIKASKELFELKKKSMSKMDKEEKVRFRAHKKMLSEAINNINREITDKIMKKAIEFSFLKFFSGIKRVPQIQLQTPYNDKEIKIAKTCILNRLERPPNYQLPEIRDDGKSVISSVKNEDQFIMQPLDDFTAVGSSRKTVMERKLKGLWIEKEDVFGCFESSQIIFNPNKFKFNQIINVEQTVDFENTNYFDKEILIFHRDEEKEEDEMIELIFGFTSQSLQEDQNKQSYAFLQLFDFNQFQQVFAHPIIHNEHCQLLEIENKATVFKINALSISNFNLYCASQNQFEFCSTSEYLTTYQGFEQKTLNIEYTSIDKNTYHIFTRIAISSDEDSVLVLNAKFVNFISYLKMKIIQVPQNNEYMLDNFEGVIKNLSEQSFFLGDYLRLEFQGNQQYYLLIEGQFPFSIPEGELQLNFYFTKEMNIVQKELIEPLEFSYHYTPTKYGILFREKIYTNQQNQLSLKARIFNSQKQEVPKDAKKGAQAEIIEQQIDPPRLIKLELYKDDKLILYNTGYNEIIFSHIDLESNKEENSHNYYLQASFDLLEWPECKKVSEETENLHCILKVCGASETIGIVKDTQKEDNIKAIKKQWEDQETGRGEKAKKSRQKFLLMQKQKNNEELTEEEIQLLNEPRLSYKDRQTETAVKDPKKKAPAKKEAPKGKQNVKKEEHTSETVIPFLPPRSEEFQTNELKAFVQELEKERVTEEMPNHQGELNVRSEENRRQIAEKAFLSSQERAEIYQRNTEQRLQLKLFTEQQEQKLKNNYKSLMDNFKQDFQNYLTKKEEIKNKLTNISTKEKEIHQLLKEETPVTIEQFEIKMKEYEAIENYSIELLRICFKFHKNLLIKNLDKQITTALETFDVETLQKCLEQYNTNQVTGICPETIEKLQEMLKEAEGNPNFTTEKLAELKKQGKKKK